MRNAEDVLKVASRWLEHGRRVCLATIVKREGSGPSEVGAKMVISSDGEVAGTVGGGAVEQKVMEQARQVMETGEPVMLELDLSGQASDLDAICGGKVSVFMESLGEARQLVVIGAGHVGRAVARLAGQVGFSVTLVDDREEYLQDLAAIPSLKVVTATFGDVGTRLKIDTSSFVVICTRGHSLDKDWLGQVVPFRPRYLGMLGSRHKAQQILDRLEDQGIAPELLARVQSPVGLDIGAVTPEEIAVSIVGQLILEWRKTGKGER